jgi:hypothetical protein
LDCGLLPGGGDKPTRPTHQYNGNHFAQMMRHGEEIPYLVVIYTCIRWGKRLQLAGG